MLGALLRVLGALLPVLSPTLTYSLQLLIPYSSLSLTFPWRALLRNPQVRSETSLDDEVYKYCYRYLNMLLHLHLVQSLHDLHLVPLGQLVHA